MINLHKYKIAPYNDVNCRYTWRMMDDAPFIARNQNRITHTSI